MPLKDHEKKAHEQLAECYSSVSSAMKSFAAGEPDGANKLTEARNRLKACFDSNNEVFSSMPDEPLMKATGHAETQPSEGTATITEEGPSNGEGQSYEGKHSFSADEMDDPRIARVLRELQSEKAERVKSQQLLAGAVGKIVRKDFDSEVADLRRQGHELPPDATIATQFAVCYSSSNPKEALNSFLGMLKAMPKRASAANYGTVLGAAGASPVPTGPKTSQARRSERTEAHEDLGVMFSAEDIDLGLKIGDILAAPVAE